MAHPTDNTELSRRASPWSRTKALTVLAAAWAVLGVVTVVVLLGAAVVGGFFAEGQSDGHRILIQLGIIGVAPIISIFAVHHIWSAIAPTPGETEDFAAIVISPLTVSIPGTLLPPAICLAGVWWQTNGDVLLAAVLGVVMMLSYSDLINQRLGPILKRHSPGLWEESLERRARQKNNESKLHHWIGPVIVIPPVLLIFVIIAKAVFGG